MKRFFFSDIESSKFYDKSKLSEIDVESYELDFKLGCWIEFDINSDIEINKKYFSNKMDYLHSFLDDLSRRNLKVIYFHNLSFDSKFIIDFLISYFDYVKPLRANSKILSIKCFKSRVVYLKNGKKKYQQDCLLELRDSLCLLLVGIEKLGKMVKIEKKEFDFDYETNWKEGIDYCFQDCRIIYFSMKYLLNFLNDFFNLFWTFRDIPLTIASLSKKIIKLFYPNVYYSVDKYLEQNLRKYYFGGRTECFNFNTLYNGVYIDVNSLYPFVLTKYLFSYGKCYRYFTDVIDFQFGVLGYECEIIENQFFPIYPIRENGKIFFSNGKKIVIITKPEYDYFVENNMLGNEIIITKVISELITYHPVNFKFLFLNMYKIRKSYESSHPYNYFLKILLNSGYGKFGQHYEQTSYEIINDLSNVDVDKEIIMDFNESFIKEKSTFNNYLQINLTNAVLTTAYARFELWKMMIMLRKLGIEIYYSDTDSLTIENKDLDKIKSYLSENEIGKCKIEIDFQLFQCIDSKEYFSIFLNEKKMKEFKAKLKGIPYQISKEKVFENVNDIKKHLEKGTKINEIGSFFYCKVRDKKATSVFVMTKHKNSFFMKRKINDDLTTNPISMDIDFKQLELENRIKILNHLESINL